MPSDPALIKFKATIGKTAISPGAGTPGAYNYKPGSFDVTFRVSQPMITADRPGKTIWIENATVDVSNPPGPAPERKPKEKDFSFSKREAAWRGHRNGHDRYLRQLEAYNAALEAYQPQMLAWAQLLGLSGLFGGKDVLVTLSPADQGLLPGFTLDALAPPATAVETPAQLAAADYRTERLSDYVSEAACVVCGCTDDRACADGCEWMDTPGGDVLCSKCADTPQGAEILGLAVLAAEAADDDDNAEATEAEMAEATA